MEVAAMNVRIMFQKNGVVSDAIGNRKNTWTDYYSCHATISDSQGKSSAESEAAGQTVFATAGLFAALDTGYHDPTDSFDCAIMGRVRLRPGDELLLYTDGATEARGADGTFFGEMGLRDAVVRNIDLDVHDIPDKIMATLYEFTENRLDDDVAMMAVRFDGLDADSTAGAPS